VIAATVLAYNLYANDRLDLFEQTVDSLSVPGVRVIPVDNGSDDGTSEIVRGMGGYVSAARNTTCGHGTNLCARVAIGTDADLCVLSDDDMHWQPGWNTELKAWWSEAPNDIVLTGCHLEPVFPWNTVKGREVYGGIPGLLRQSTGAASWSFRRGDWPVIGPVPQSQQGYGDVPACERLIANGYRIAQLDLATHAGHGRSSWGNRTIEMHGWDIAPVQRALENP
jgi:glycosyltransferase involved in cell wall biosynthesis